MARPLSSMFALYTLTPGRRIYTLRRVRKLAAAKELSPIVESIDQAIAQDGKALDLDAKRLDPRPPKRAKEKDARVDEVLMTLDVLLSYHAGKQNDGAVAMQATLFPGGAHYHIRMPHIEQAAANERVLKILESAKEKAWVDAHGLRPLVLDLRTAHDEFDAALNARHGHTRVSWDKVKEARAAGQELYLKVVVQILAEFLADPDTRDQLMAPIWQQEELVRAYRRQRRGGLADVDPDSGELLADEEGSEESQEGADQEAAQEEPALLES